MTKADVSTFNLFFVPQLIRKVIIKILRFYEFEEVVVVKIIICVAKFTKILLASAPSVRVLPNKSVLSGIF